MSRDPERRAPRRAERESDPAIASGRLPSDLGPRVLVALPAAAILVLLVDLGGLALALPLAALAVLGFRELCGLTRRAAPFAVAGYAAVAALPLAALYGGPPAIALVLAASPALVFAALLAASPRAGSTEAIAMSVLGIVWIGGGLAHGVLLTELPHGTGLALDVLIATFVGDTAAHLVGSRFGRRPLAARVSPKKTVEGLVAGVVAGTLAVVAAGALQDWLSGFAALALGLSVALAAPVGDLFESQVKRDAGVKDSGRFFGAHGGVLDRMDAVLFTIVAGYYASSAFA